MDVIVGEVVGVDRREGVADLQIDQDMGGARRQVDVFTRPVGAAGGAYAHTVHRHVHVVGVERGIGGADRGEHAPPVRVLAEDGGLEQVVASDRATHLDGVVFGDGTDDLDRDVVARPLRIGLQLDREVGAHVDERGAERIGLRRDPGCAARHEGHLVVGGHAAVGIEPIEAHSGGRAQVRIRLGRGHDGVGRHDDEHRRQARCEHPRPFRHGTDRPAVDGADRPLRPRVRRHDRKRGVFSAVCGQRGDRLLGPFEHFAAEDGVAGAD